MNPRTSSDLCHCFFFFQAEDGIRDLIVTGVQTCALPIYARGQPGGITINKSNVEQFKGVLDDGLYLTLMNGWDELHVGPTTQFEMNKHYEIGRASCRERV